MLGASRRATAWRGRLLQKAAPLESAEVDGNDLFARLARRERFHSDKYLTLGNCIGDLCATTSRAEIVGDDLPILHAIGV